MRIITIPAPYVERASPAKCPRCNKQSATRYRYYADDDYRVFYASTLACMACKHYEQRDGAGNTCQIIFPNEAPKKFTDSS